MTDREPAEALIERETISPEHYQQAVIAQVDQDWFAKQPDPLLALSGRLYGETRELVTEDIEMFAAVKFGRGNALDNVHLATKIKSELGDILWYATLLQVLTSHGSRTLPEALADGSRRIAEADTVVADFDEFQARVYEHRGGIEFWRGANSESAWANASDPEFEGIFAEPLDQIMWLAELLGRKIADDWEYVKEDATFPEEMEVIQAYLAEIRLVPQTGEMPDFPIIPRRPDRQISYIERLRDVPAAHVIENLIAMVAVAARSVIDTDLFEVARYNLWKIEERKKHGTVLDKTKRVIDAETGEKL